MGLGVVQSLVRNGFAVSARDILPDAEASAVAAGAVAYPTPATITRECRTVILLVVDAAQIDDVLFGEHGAASEWRPGDVLIVSSTVPPSYVEALAARVGAFGVRLIDAPVSGGPRRASEGTMTIMLSGDEQAIGECAAMFDAIAARRFVVGARAGNAAMFKVLNNQLAAVNLAAGAEAMAIAMRAGLDRRLFVDVVGASSGASWIFADRMARVLEDDYRARAATTLLQKDVAIALANAVSLDCDAPIARAAREAFDAAVAAGHGAEDDAALVKYYSSRAGRT
jgi:3-hydroxyisobutyrate dehydrogenase-like beta-hydroxyacid dehydrogenase